MGVLHLVSRSPHESSSLALCLARAGEGDAVLLLEDAVYAALNDSAFAPQLQQACGKLALYVLTPDLVVRGIETEERIAGLMPVDYAGFVELSLRHTPILSWF
jgi:tRNA 2-thiouridine synthesizing protein B